MSRVGKKPISIPDKTTVTYKDRLITIKGQKGALSRSIHPDVNLSIKDGIIQVEPIEDTREGRALQGMTRSLVSNMVTGVNNGFERVLEINGIGYRATLSGKTLVLNLGFSHPINYDLPDGVDATVDKNNTIRLSGIDKEKVGHVAAAIRQIQAARTLQGQGCQIRRRAHYPQGRQDRNQITCSEKIGARPIIDAMDMEL